MKNYIKKACYSLGGLLIANSVYANDNHPNVIVIYTDDQGTLDLNSYGASDLYTPNIDKLAEEGIRFTQFYAAPVSSVSRAGLLTGQFAKHVGVVGNVGRTGLPLEKETIAERLKDNGYNTALLGKWHLASDINHGPNVQGFDYFWGFRGGCVDNYSHYIYWGGPHEHDLWENERKIYKPGTYLIDESLDKMKGFIANSKDNPFFIYWAVNIPHYPLQPDPKWLDYYSSLPTPRKMYAASMSTLDDYVGQMCRYLEAEGLRENTIIIFQSDNGHSMEDRAFGEGGYAGPYRAAKFSLFEGGIRVPAILNWPAKLPKGEIREQIAMNIDWFPTIIDLCGIATKDMNVDGKSLLPIVVDNKKEVHEVLHFDFSEQWAVRNGDWKLIYKPVDIYPNARIQLDDEYYLTNIKIDASEKTNLKDEYPLKVKELLELRNDFEQSLAK